MVRALVKQVSARPDLEAMFHGLMPNTDFVALIVLLKAALVWPVKVPAS